MAGWALRPDELSEKTSAKIYAGGAFLSTVIAFFLAEISDKTQLATAVLAAQFGQLVPVVIGTTLGMMIADDPLFCSGTSPVSALILGSRAISPPQFLRRSGSSRLPGASSSRRAAASNEGLLQTPFGRMTVRRGAMTTNNSSPTSDRPKPELALEWALFASRWILAPLYLSMILVLGGILIVFLRELVTELAHVWSMDGEQIILLALSLIDLSLTSNLLLIVIFAGTRTSCRKSMSANMRTARAGWAWSTSPI